MKIRYRSFLNTQLEEMLVDFVTQKGSGIATTTINGETITFRGPAAIETEILALEAELQAREDKEANITRKFSGVFYPGSNGKGWL